MATNTSTPKQTKRPDQVLDQLRMSIRGEVLTPEEPGYATVPVPFNAMYPGRPAIVVRAAGVADVIDAVRFAREHGLQMAIRGGGHSVAGLSSVDDGLLLELTLMNGVDVNLEEASYASKAERGGPTSTVTPRPSGWWRRAESCRIPESRG